MISNNKKTRQKQTLTFCLFFCVFVSFLFYLTFSIKNTPGKKSQQQKIMEKKAELPLDKIDSHAIWRKKIKSESFFVKKKLDDIQTRLLEKNKKGKEESTDLKKEVDSLRKELQQHKSSPSQKKDSEEFSWGKSPFDYTSEDSGQQSPAQTKEKPALKIVTLETLDSDFCNVETDIPAGTTIKALIVSSVDAPCGVLSRGDPQPVKLRILDNGHLPKGIKSKLKGSLILAGAVGDISSERVFMRTEKLTIFSRNGDFVETNIAGYISGEDGKYGVRGYIVDKSSKMVGNAAFSGIFSGFSDYLQSVNISKRSCSCGQCDYCKNYSLGATDIAKYSGAKGAGNAFDMLTDYYIKRAEQIQPVIQISAGRTVDVTFTHSCSIGELNTKKKNRTRKRGKPC